MEGDLASLWWHEESLEEIKQKLLYTTLELESTRTEANEELEKNKETIAHLLHLLNLAYQERDEARCQLHQLLSQVASSTTNLHHIDAEITLPDPNQANSTITESGSRSPSGGCSSSPLESISDSAQHGIPVHEAILQDFNCNLVKRKPLPQKGKFLQAVMEAGPLLHTLFVAGPLPQWRNPPWLKVPGPSLGIQTQVYLETSPESYFNFYPNFKRQKFQSGCMRSWER